MGAVEREHTRLDGRQAQAAGDAGEALTHQPGLGFSSDGHEHDAVAQFQGKLNRVGDPGAFACTYDNAVHDHVQIVAAGAPQDDLIAKVDNLTVDANPNEALTPEPFQFDFQFTFSPAADGSQQGAARLLFELQQTVDDLLWRLGFDAFATTGAVGNAKACEEQAQVVRDFRYGPYRRARVLGQRALFDGDGRTQTFDGVDVGLGELLQELPRVGGERFNIATLSFGVDGVKSQRRLARATGPRDHHQPIARQT